jgi:hypothetical protein
MGEIMSGVSWIGVIVGAVVAFLAGWAIYSPMLFGKGWAEGSRVEMGEASEMPKAAMIGQGVGLFLMSWFVGVTAAHEMLLTVILATVAFTVLAWAGSAFAQVSTYARNVNAGYWITALVIMIIAQGIF